MRLRLLAVFVLVAGTIACAKRVGSSGDEVPRPVGPWSDWLLLDQPESSVILDHAFAGVGSPSPGCFHSDSASINSGSYAQYKLAWTKKKKGGITAAIAHVFGFGSAYDKSTTGEIVFDSVYIARAVGQYPLPDCPEAALDQLPIRPGVAALIGAKRFTYDLVDKRGKHLNADVQISIKNHDVSGTVAFDNSDETHVSASFDRPMWFGAQYVGYEADAATEHYLTAPTQLGKWVGLPQIHFQVRADSQAQNGVDNGNYRLIVESLSPGGMTDTVTVQDGRSFQFGRPAGSSLGGAFFTGTFTTGGKDQSEYIVSVDRNHYINRVFARNSDESALADWVDARKNGRKP